MSVVSSYTRKEAPVISIETMCSDFELSTGTIINGDKFIDYVRWKLILNMHPFRDWLILVMDNCLSCYIKYYLKQHDEIILVLEDITPFLNQFFTV